MTKSWITLALTATALIGNPAHAVEVRFQSVAPGVYAHVGDTGGRTFEHEGLNALKQRLDGTDLSVAVNGLTVRRSNTCSMPTSGCPNWLTAPTSRWSASKRPTPGHFNSFQLN